MKFNHQDEDGRAVMVDVSHKAKMRRNLKWPIISSQRGENEGACHSGGEDYLLAICYSHAPHLTGCRFMKNSSQVLLRVAAIKYKFQIVFIRFIGKYNEYDRIKAEEI